MFRSAVLAVPMAAATLLAIQFPSGSETWSPAAAPIAYRVESGPTDLAQLKRNYSATQLQLLEKLNRADMEHLPRLKTLVVPESWTTDELAYSPLPAIYGSAEGHPKVVVIYLPGQVFGAYENGKLVRWGPVSSGVSHSPTPPGLYHLNWKASRHVSTEDPTWIMTWYFNFENKDGRALHAYAMPGYPASHSCVRMLERDAQWLYEWGEQWTLDEKGWNVLEPGTPVLLVGAYDFDAPPPWRSPAWLAKKPSLPAIPDTPPL
ncbi:MAG: L,D-transpeptidase [Acidobacteria bacterium]|nr:L,D-transpeptidase [Acidobacteriota bacterium]